MHTTPTAEAVKGAISPLDFFQAELPDFNPKRTTGWLDGGLCPFHQDRRPGSFKICLDSGSFRCFSCGARGGDIISFVMLRDGLKFRDALGALAAAWGVV